MSARTHAKYEFDSWMRLFSDEADEESHAKNHAMVTYSWVPVSTIAVEADRLRKPKTRIKTARPLTTVFTVLRHAYRISSFLLTWRHKVSGVSVKPRGGNRVGNKPNRGDDNPLTDPTSLPQDQVNPNDLETQKSSTKGQ